MKTGLWSWLSRLKRPLPASLLFAVAVLLGSILGVAASSPALLVSVPDPSQNPASSGGADSIAPALSPDGRYVLFASAACNLVPQTASNLSWALVPVQNVYLRDRDSGTTALVSINSLHAGGGNGDSVPVAVSTNGRYALFESSASDLVPTDTNGVNDVFLRDQGTGTTILISASTNGGPGDAASSAPVMTPDGRYVAFVSGASNLVANDTNAIPDIFVRDVQNGVTTLVSVGAIPTDSTSGSEAPEITPDGRYVAFYSIAGGLAPGISNVGDLFVRDMAAQTTWWVSVGARSLVMEVMGATNAFSYNHSISADGKYVVYEASPWSGEGAAPAGLVLRYSLEHGTTLTISTNASVPTGMYQDAQSLAITPDGRVVAFVGNASPAPSTNTCVYVWNEQTGTTSPASVDLSNAIPTGATCDWPAIDTTGRFVAFLSNGTNLVTNAVAGELHLYERDLQTGITSLVDIDLNGRGVGVSLMTVPRLSADGHQIAFEAAGVNLVSGDRGRSYDVVVRDASASATELISARDPTLPCLTPNGPSVFAPLALSEDGRCLAFSSDADDLVPGDGNGCSDVFVRDLVFNTNRLISVSTNGVNSANGESTDAAISADGRYVVFSSTADDLVAGDTNRARDVFVRDLWGGTTTLASVGTNGISPGNGDSYLPMLGANNRFLFFRSKATNLTRGNFSGAENLFMRDLQAGTNAALSVSGLSFAMMTPNRRHVPYAIVVSDIHVRDAQTGSQLASFAVGKASPAQVSPDGKWIAWVQFGNLTVRYRTAGTNFTVSAQCSTPSAAPHFSADSRYLAYAGAAAQAPNDTNGVSDIYLYDFQTGTNLLISRSYIWPGAPNGPSDSPDISADGRFLAYRSWASDVVPGDTNGCADVFLYDRTSGATILLSVNQAGLTGGNNVSTAPLFCGDGRTVVFQSSASDLTMGDFNSSADIFAVSLYSSAPIPLFAARISPGSAPGQRPWISWPVLPGKTYRVQIKDNLSDAGWQDLAAGITIVGNEGRLSDFTPSSNQRCYRIVAY